MKISFSIQTKIKFFREDDKRRLNGSIYFYKYVNYTKKMGLADDYVIPTLVARISDSGVVETEELAVKWGLSFFLSNFHSYFRRNIHTINIRHLFLGAFGICCREQYTLCVLLYNQNLNGVQAEQRSLCYWPLSIVPDKNLSLPEAMEHILIVYLF